MIESGWGVRFDLGGIALEWDEGRRLWLERWSAVGVVADSADG